MNGSSELEAPLLLMAMPQVQDPFFAKSVVLLVHHQPEGSLGFVVNRPTVLKVAEILDGLEIPWGGDSEHTAFLGGPVQQQLGTVIYRAEAAPAITEERREICPGVAVTQHVGDLQALAEKPPASFRLLLGYAQWGDDQLTDEMLRNDWLTAPVDVDLIFQDDPELIWSAALASVGIDPALLPSWTPDGNGETAN